MERFVTFWVELWEDAEDMLCPIGSNEDFIYY